MTWVGVAQWSLLMIVAAVLVNTVCADLIEKWKKE
jgi:hypothetical protein